MEAGQGRKRKATEMEYQWDAAAEGGWPLRGSATGGGVKRGACEGSPPSNSCLLSGSCAAFLPISCPLLPPGYLPAPLRASPPPHTHPPAHPSHGCRRVQGLPGQGGQADRHRRHPQPGHRGRPAGQGGRRQGVSGTPASRQLPDCAAGCLLPGAPGSRIWAACAAGLAADSPLLLPPPLAPPCCRLWAAGSEAGYEVFIVQPLETDPEVCACAALCVLCAPHRAQACPPLAPCPAQLLVLSSALRCCRPAPCHAHSASTLPLLSQGLSPSSPWLAPPHPPTPAGVLQAQPACAHPGGHPGPGCPVGGGQQRLPIYGGSQVHARHGWVGAWTPGPGMAARARGGGG